MVVAVVAVLVVQTAVYDVVDVIAVRYGFVAAAFAVNMTGTSLHGVVMCCACVFLLKYVLFALVSAHLRQDAAAEQRALLQLLPLAVFGGYVAYYFMGLS